MKKRKFKKVFLFLFLACVCLCLLLAIGIGTVCLIVSATSDNNIKNCEDVNKKYDCILILGAKVYSDGTPCPMLRDRLDTGATLYFNGVSEKIIVSGDHGQTEYDEVNAMKEYLTNLGIPENVIFMDHAGFCTYDSLHRTFSIFGAKSVAIVTQEFHLPRAVYIAEMYGLETVGVSADLNKYAGIEYNYLREVPAQVKDFFLVMFSAPPTYGGETISLSDDASVTDG